MIDPFKMEFFHESLETNALYPLSTLSLAEEVWTIIEENKGVMP